MAGAVAVPVEMPRDGEMTLALYSPEGRLVRILGQCLPLRAGLYEARWDGMDLWGAMVPAGTALTVKTFTGPGLKARYEFTVGHANTTPWLTKPVGEGMAMRTGGWMGDHSPPQSVVAVGEKLFFGCTVAEHGHALIATDLEGNKLWGTNGLDGWGGPSRMACDGKYVYCDAKERDLWRVDVQTFEKKRIAQTGEAKVAGIAARGGQVFVILSQDGNTSIPIFTPDGGHGGSLMLPGVKVLSGIAADADGTLHVLADNRLAKVKESKLAPTPTLEVLNEKDLRKPVSLCVTADRILVGDDGLSAVLVLDKQGKLLHRLGNKGPRKAGPWDPTVIQRPAGVALDKNGKVWVAEALYVPKRLARFHVDGTCEKEFFGPAEYGGGGYLDSNLKRFYYRSMEYALDFEKGRWTLLNLNDHIANPFTPAPQAGGFTYTTIGRPIYHKGHRYLVANPERSDGAVITLLDDGMATWRPCAVLKSCLDTHTNRRTRERTYTLSVFLGKPHWNGYWQRKMDAGELKDKAFLWSDHNGDGLPQVEEVEQVDFKPYGGDPFGAPFFGSWVGPSLEVWTRRSRIAPRSITDKGVPIYRAADLAVFDHAKLAPVYRRSFTVRLGSSANAKPDYGATSIIAADGSLVLEGQPYLVAPDLTLKGGPLAGYVPPAPRTPATKGAPASRPASPSAVPTDFVPPIFGKIMDQPLHYVGTAMTRSPAGEVAMLNGNNGRWFIMSVQDRVLLGEIFTGESGSWSTDLAPRRGEDVTGRKQDWECFFGHFTRADNGRYYVVAGHTFHAISRVENLDDFQVARSRIRVPADSIAANTRLREVLRNQQAALDGAREVKKLVLGPLARRAAAFQLDGDLAEWGDRLQPIGDADLNLAFDAAWGADGLYLAYRGKSYTGNASEDLNLLFQTGFSLDVQYRSNTNAKTKDVAVGDRRIVFAQHKGKWVAVLYDYLDPATPPGKHVEFSSPLITTRVARVTPIEDAKVAVKRGDPCTVANWSAEAFVPWRSLGLPPDARGPVRMDFGILTPDSGGVRVEKRTYWSNRATDMVADLGMEAQINPGAWGEVTFEK
jgi:hypothetical protein